MLRRQVLKASSPMPNHICCTCGLFEAITQPGRRNAKNLVIDMRDWPKTRNRHRLAAAVKNWANATTSRVEALARLRQVAPLERQRNQLTSTICSLRAQVQIRDGQIERLELAMRERNERIDELRYANQRLGLQNEVLVAMIAAPPPVDAAMLSSK